MNKASFFKAVSQLSIHRSVSSSVDAVRVARQSSIISDHQRRRYSQPTAPLSLAPSNASNSSNDPLADLTSTSNTLSNCTIPKSTTNCNAKLRTSIRMLLESPPTEHSLVTAQGWVRSVRILKKIAFIDISDGTSHHSLMLVTSPTLAKQSRVTTGCSVEVVGKWVQSKGKNQNFELQINDTIAEGENQSHGLKIVGPVEENYPLQKKYHTPEFVRSLNTLKFQTSKLNSVIRARSFLEWKFSEFFQKEGFVKTNPPLITGADCEGAGELFQVEGASILEKQIKNLSKKEDNNNKSAGNDDNVKPFFGKKSYLTVSTQLHLEILAQSFSKVWTMSPCFRAEASDTNRHLSEFWMLEAEIAYAATVDQLTYFAERMLKHCINGVLCNENYALDNLLQNSKRPVEELSEIERRLRILENAGKPWAQITYHEAMKILLQAKKKWDYVSPAMGESLSTEHEKFLTNEVFKAPLFVTNYPKDEKAFYMEIDTNGQTVACFDLLFPVMGELIGGSVREANYGKLLKEIERRNMNISELQWYLDLRKNGSVPHGGFGMGFERLVSFVCNVDNIKDVIPLSRSVNNCEC